MKEQIKVYAYITRGTELLIFEERGFPEGGLQIPGGTPEPGEDFARAAFREAKEETDLKDLRMNRFLGEDRFDVSIYGVNEIHRRMFFHILCDKATPDTWTQIEK
ncbi:MAG: NUDIX domain-containing protein, partial [Candidatus Thorarchaeota archaeon]